MVHAQRDHRHRQGGASRLRRPATNWLFALLAGAATLLVVTWTLAIGRYGGPDEPAHVTRAAAVADGQWRGEATDAFAPGYRVVTVPARLASGDPSCYRHDSTIPAACAEARDAPGSVRVASAAGINPPWYYALVGYPVRWFGDPADSTWYRLVAALWSVLVVALVAWRLAPFGRAAIAALVFVTPAAWFMVGVVNPNGAEILLALLAWVGVARILAAERPAVLADWWWVTIPLALAVAMRPIAVLAVLATAAVVTVSRRRPRGRTALAAVTPLGLAVLSIVVWDRVVDARWTDPRTADPVGAAAAARTAIGGTDDTIREMVGSLGWLEYTAGVPVELLWWGAAIAAASLAARANGAVWIRLGTLWSALVVLPIAFEVLFHGRVGFIWQGRYSIPVLIGSGAILLASGWRPGSRPLAGLLLAAATGEVATFLVVLHRSTVGTDGPWSMTGTGAWEPLLTPWLLVTLHLTAVAALAVAVVRGRSTVHVTT